MRNFRTLLLPVFLAFTLLFLSANVALATVDPISSNSEEEANEAYNDIKKYLESFKNGNFVIGTTTMDGVKSMVGPYVTQTETAITYKRSFTGYSFTSEWSFTEGKLSYFSVNTFYDAEKYDNVSSDAEEIRALVTKIFGTPVSTETTYADWEHEEILISFDVFEDGYSLYIDPLSGDGSYSDITCVGDFYNLKKDLKEIFIANMKNGAIKIGSTTKDQIQTITGNGESFYKEYDGLWATASYTYDENGKLSSLTIDYFYDCSGALILLDIDKGDITTIINEELGADGFKDTDAVDATVRWNVNGQSLRQEGYEDGYAILFDK